MRAAPHTSRPFRLWPRRSQSPPAIARRSDGAHSTPQHAAAQDTMVPRAKSVAHCYPASAAPSPVAECQKPCSKHDVPGLTRLDMAVWAVVACASVALAIVPMVLATAGLAAVPVVACAAAMLVALVLGGLFLALRDAYRRRQAREQTLDRRPDVHAAEAPP